MELEIFYTKEETEGERVKRHFFDGCKKQRTGGRLTTEVK